MAKLKTTVLKKLNKKDLYGENPPITVDEELMPPECDRFSVGQEFIVLDTLECPPNFCSWAFNDIFRDMATLLQGGDLYPYIKDRGVIVACCTDGLRPVIFKLERIED